MLRASEAAIIVSIRVAPAPLARSMASGYVSLLPSIVTQKLLHLDGTQYELGAYVIMPNHVHVLVRPFSDEQNPLEHIVQAWKAISAREINEAGGQTGQLWQLESFDRIVRDEEHLWRCLQYIGDNARRAALDVHRIPRWINPKWIAAGWQFENRSP